MVSKRATFLEVKISSQLPMTSRRVWLYFCWRPLLYCHNSFSFSYHVSFALSLALALVFVCLRLGHKNLTLPPFCVSAFLVRQMRAHPGWTG